ncbi:MAG: XrtA/PEP-CTERM system TPR-repeat protein PrsT [Pseudomonadota bacterium]
MTHSNTRRIAASMLLSTAIAGLSACGKNETSQSLIEDARQYQAKGDTKAAIIQLKNALQKNPNDAQARYALGVVYLESGDSLSAQKELEKAVSLGMSSDKVAPVLGQAFVQEGKFQQALDAMPLPTSGQPTVALLTARGTTLLGMGKQAEAKAAFDLALKTDPKSVEALIGLAQHAKVANDISGATRYIDQAVAANPANIDALLAKGDLLRAAGKNAEALAVFDQALKIRPDLVGALISKATIHIAEKRFDVAAKEIDAARKLAPASLMIQYTQALLDFSQKKNPAALENLQQVLSKAPNHMPTILLTAAVQAETGANEQAEQNLKRYLEANPNSVYARRLLASVLAKTGQSDLAANVLTPPAGGKPDPQMMMLAGETALRAQDYVKASEYFEAASKAAPGTAVAHTALAMSKLGQGDNTKAISELELAASLNAKSDAKSSNASILLVMTRLRLNQFKEALTLLTTLEKEQPDSPLIHNLKGGAYMGLKDTGNARASFAKAIALQPTFLPAVQNMAQLDMQDKKPEEAKKRFLTVLDIDKKNVGAMMALASLATTLGKADEATTWLEKASAEKPNDLGMSVQLGNHYVRIGQKAKALALAQKLQAANPANPDVLDLLGQAQFANDDRAGALTTYNKVIAAVPNSALAHFRIASVQLASQDPKAAIISLKKAISLKPDYLDAQLALATLEGRQNNIDGALAIAKQIQKQRPNDAASVVLEGDLLAAQKKFSPAAVAYERALTMSKNPSVNIKLHQVLSNAGRAKEADVKLTKWVQDHPEDLSSQVYQGERLLQNKSTKPAIAIFERVLQTVPTNALVLNNLAYAYQQEKDGRALQTAEKALQFAPDNPAVLDTLGWILVEQGNAERGVTLLQKAVSGLPKDAELTPVTAQIHLHLARGLIKTGDKVGARKELEQVISSGKNFPELDDAKALLKTL